LLKIFCILLLLPLLAACAAPARQEMMIATTLAPDASGMLGTSPLKGQVTVASISGGEDTNPMWVSKVGNPEFTSALNNSLRKFGLLNEEGKGRYTLDASLLSLAQPIMGFDMTVTATVRYLLKDTDGGVVWDQHVVKPYTATMGDAFIGVERLKMANEGAIRINIETALGDMLRTVKPSHSPAPAGTPVS